MTFFRYHPDPIATGSAEVSDVACGVCSERTGYRYVGPRFGDELGEICLGCIASGAAVARMAASGEQAGFTDLWGVPEDVPRAVLEELEQRTPGYYAWQESRWLFHCGDGAAYLGRVGWDQVQNDAEALRSLEAEVHEIGMDDARARQWITSLSADGDLTAYLFACLHCGIHLAYSDAN